MSQKTIQIDPKYLAASSAGTSQRSTAGGTRRKGRKEKPKAATLVKPDKMKKQWIAKVKEFQKKRQDEEACHHATARKTCEQGYVVGNNDTEADSQVEAGFGGASPPVKRLSYSCQP